MKVLLRANLVNNYQYLIRRDKITLQYTIFSTSGIIMLYEIYSYTVAYAITYLDIKLFRIDFFFFLALQVTQLYIE